VRSVGMTPACVPPAGRPPTMTTKTKPTTSGKTRSRPLPTRDRDQPLKSLSVADADADGFEEAPPVLRFTPTAWAKLLFFCHRGDTEIGGFGVTGSEDLLRIEAFETIEQVTTAVSVAFDDAAVADFFETQVDAGRRPEQFARCWLHTHPGDSPEPSSVDEETFGRVFGGCDWAVMFILARTGATYARLRFNVGPGGEQVLPVEIDYRSEFAGSDRASWQREYQAHIHPVWGYEPLLGHGRGRRFTGPAPTGVGAAAITDWDEGDFAIAGERPAGDSAIDKLFDEDGRIVMDIEGGARADDSPVGRRRP